jgi:hypothetical protein
MKTFQVTNENDPNDVNHGDQLNPDHREYHHSREND